MNKFKIQTKSINYSKNCFNFLNLLLKLNIISYIKIFENHKKKFIFIKLKIFTKLISYIKPSNKCFLTKYSMRKLQQRFPAIYVYCNSGGFKINEFGKTTDGGLLIAKIIL